MGGNKTKTVLALTLTALSLMTASAASCTWQASLDQVQEIPAPVSVPGAGGPAFGTNDDLTNILTGNISLVDLSGAATGIHIDGESMPGINSAVPVIVHSVSVFGTPNVGQTILTDPQKVGRLSGLWDINIHSSLNPAGEFRGQVNIGAVPVPEALGFLLAAFAAVGGPACRRI